MTSDLDEAVYELTEIKIHYEPQITTEPSLFDQLEEAVRSSAGTGGASKAAANERSPLNPAALAIRDEIRQHITAWCVKSNIRAGRNLTGNLRRWHTANPDAGEWHISELHRFARMIRGHFTNIKRAAIETPCPVCHATTWTDQHGDTYLWPLERTRIDGQHITRVRATCRACETEWDDLEAVAELRDELAESGALDTPEPEHLPVKEAARRLRCTRRTVERKIADGTLDTIKVGWHTRITLESVNALIAQKHADNRARA